MKSVAGGAFSLSGHIFNQGFSTFHQELKKGFNSSKRRSNPMDIACYGHISMDWFEGKLKQESPMIFIGKYRWLPVKIFPTKPIHWIYQPFIDDSPMFSHGPILPSGNLT